MKKKIIIFVLLVLSSSVFANLFGKANLSGGARQLGEVKYSGSGDIIYNETLSAVNFGLYYEFNSENSPSFFIGVREAFYDEFCYPGISLGCFIPLWESRLYVWDVILEGTLAYSLDSDDVAGIATVSLMGMHPSRQGFFFDIAIDVLGKRGCFYNDSRSGIVIYQDISLGIGYKL